MQVPVFRNQRSLSLGDLDTMGNMVRRHEQSLNSVGGGARMGAAKTGRAWYVPSAVSGVGSAPGFTCISAGTIAGVEHREGLAAPLIVNGVLLLPPGGGDAPLAHFGNDVSSPVAGILRGGEVFWGTCIAAHSGVLYFPLAEAPGSSVCSVSSVPNIPGVIKGAEIRSSIGAPCISSGVLYFPLAEAPGGSDSPGSSVASIPGAIKGAKISDSVAAPCIASGVLVIPMAVATPAAAIPGVIKGAEVDEQSAAPYIASGVLYFPRQSGGINGLRSVSGLELSWAEVQGAAGGQVPVASVSLRIGANDYTQLELYAGLSEGGHLTFSLTST